MKSKKVFGIFNIVDILLILIVIIVGIVGGRMLLGYLGCYGLHRPFVLHPV